MGSQQILLITAKKYRLSNTYYIQILNMSLTFFHPCSMKPRYLRRKPINMCFDDLNLKLQSNNHFEDNENNFITKIKLEGFEPKDINLELSSDKRKIKVTA